MKRPQIPAIKQEPVCLLRQNRKRPTVQRSCRGQGQDALMGRHSPDSRTRMSTPMSATQLYK